jgi:multicomponent Na+:H+ antiporter subunit C
VTGGTAPILVEAAEHADEAGEGAAEAAAGAAEAIIYSNPIQHVLMLTAIVVGVATLALGLSLVVRIKEA